MILKLSCVTPESLNLIGPVEFQSVEFPYLVKVAIYDPGNEGYWNIRVQIDTWLRDNLKSHYLYVSDMQYSVIAFDTEEHRNWFILRW